jgi:hypothetical protein
MTMKWKTLLLPASAAAAALIFGLRRRVPEELTPTYPSEAMGTPRDAVVGLALSQLGSADADRYWDEVSGPEGHPDTSWCAAFALWVLRKAGLTDWTYDPDGAWFYRLPRTSNPEPGDLVFFPDTRHLAMIESSEDGGVWTINGAGTGGVVSRGFVSREDLASRAAEIVSIEPLVRAYALSA